MEAETTGKGRGSGAGAGGEPTLWVLVATATAMAGVVAGTVVADVVGMAQAMGCWAVAALVVAAATLCHVVHEDLEAGRPVARWRRRIAGLAAAALAAGAVGAVVLAFIAGALVTGALIGWIGAGG